VVDVSAGLRLINDGTAISSPRKAAYEVERLSGQALRSADWHVAAVQSNDVKVTASVPDSQTRSVGQLSAVRRKSWCVIECGQPRRGDLMCLLIVDGNQEDPGGVVLRSALSRGGDEVPVG